MGNVKDLHLFNNKRKKTVNQPVEPNNNVTEGLTIHTYFVAHKEKTDLIAHMGLMATECERALLVNRTNR